MAKALSTTGKIDIYGIFFDVDRTELKPESRTTLEEVAKLLKSDPSLRVEVAGHTDNTGGADHNMKLSRRTRRRRGERARRHLRDRQDPIAAQGIRRHQAGGAQ